jgi:hypothetical protein
MRAILTVCALIVAARGSAIAQPADTISGPRGPLIRTSDLRNAGLGAAATVLLLALVDRPVQEAAVKPSLQDNRTLKRISERVAPINEVRSLYISTGVYGLGLIARRNRVADIGLHSMEAIVLSRLVTDAIGGSLGRGRPYEAGASDPHLFEWGKGLSKHGYNSLPSRHVTGVSAMATVVTREVAMSWPGAKKWVAPVGYGLSTLVGLGRVYTSHHWLSDVAAGTVVGTLVGTAVTRFHHTHPGNGFDRVMLGRASSDSPTLGLSFKF